MTAAKAVGCVTEIIHRKHLAFTKERSYWARLRRYCDNVKGLLFYVPSEHQTEWFLTALKVNLRDSQSATKFFRTGNTLNARRPAVRSAL